jgi:hypothetical protein
VGGNVLGPGEDSTSAVIKALPRDEPSLVTLGGKRKLIPPGFRGDDDAGEATPEAMGVVGAGDGPLKTVLTLRGMRVTPMGAAAAVAGASFSSSGSDDDELDPSSSSLEFELDDTSIAARSDAAADDPALLLASSPSHSCTFPSPNRNVNPTPGFGFAASTPGIATAAFGPSGDGSTLGAAATNLVGGCLITRGMRITPIGVLAGFCHRTVSKTQTRTLH